MSFDKWDGDLEGNSETSGPNISLIQADTDYWDSDSVSGHLTREAFAERASAALFEAKARLQLLEFVLSKPSRITSQRSETWISQFIKGLMARWNLSEPEMIVLLGLQSPPDLKRVITSGEVKGRDAEDRIANLFYIYETLFSLLGDNKEEENKILREQYKSLEGKMPLDRMLHGSLEDLIDVKRWIENIAGR